MAIFEFLLSKFPIMAQNTIKHLKREIAALPSMFENLQYTYRLRIMDKNASFLFLQYGTYHRFTCMPKRCMSNIMTNRYRLNKVFI